MAAEVGMAAEGVVRLREVLQKHSLRNIIESVFGSGLEMGTKEELSDMVREGYELIAEFNWEDYFPLRFLDFGGVKRKCHELGRRVNVVVGRIVEQRKTQPNAQSHSHFNNDFLASLLTLPKEDQLSDSDMVAVLWVTSLSLSAFTKQKFWPQFSFLFFFRLQFSFFFFLKIKLTFNFLFVFVVMRLHSPTQNFKIRKIAFCFKTKN